jgi:hypothetical protein
MIDESTVLNSIIDWNIKLSYPLLRDQSDQDRFIAFIDVKYDQDGIRRPSEKYVSELKRYFLTIGVYIDFISAKNGAVSIEEKLRFILINNHGDLIRNSFLSIDKNSANVWVVPKRDLSPFERDTVRNISIEFLKQESLTLSGFEFSGESNLISKTGCISLIRKFAPISQENLRIKIEERGFVVPSDNWLSRMLDNIRRSSFVMRKGDGTYVLTLAGLRAGGTVKTPRSPDVQRMLELGRRSG